jgi:hypothetical protein
VLPPLQLLGVGELEADVWNTNVFPLASKSGCFHFEESFAIWL